MIVLVLDIVKPTNHVFDPALESTPDHDMEVMFLVYMYRPALMTD